jgi:hypothetical protein
MIVRAEVGRRRSPFDFSRAQREAINQAVHDGCAQPGIFDFKGLLRAANRYKKEMATYRSPSARSSDWRRAAHLVEKARDAVACVDTYGLTDQFLVLPDEANPSVMDVLSRLEQFALNMSRAVGHDRHPRACLSEEALDYWSSAGGLIRKSRAPGNGIVGGPTVRYMEAVLGSVMDDDAPGLERIRQIIDEYATHLMDMLATDRDGELAAALEAAQNGEDVHAAAMGVLRGRKKPQGGSRRANRIWARRLVKGPARVRGF